MSRLLGMLALFIALVAMPATIALTHGPDCDAKATEVAAHGHSHADGTDTHDPTDHEHHAEAALPVSGTSVWPQGQAHPTNVVLVPEATIRHHPRRPPRFV